MVIALKAIAEDSMENITKWSINIVISETFNDKNF